MPEPWENEDGSTNVDGFLAAFEQDDLTFWRADHGHILNVLYELIERTEEMEALHNAALAALDALGASDELNDAEACAYCGRQLDEHSHDELMRCGSEATS